jgi:hypothetical protein
MGKRRSRHIQAWSITLDPHPQAMEVVVRDKNQALDQLDKVGGVGRAAVYRFAQTLTTTETCAWLQCG